MSNVLLADGLGRPSYDCKLARMLKLLYLSCHAVLEYDELLLFDELGLDVFPLGAYTHRTQHDAGCLRPILPSRLVDSDDFAAFSRLAAEEGDVRDRLTRDFVDRFDAIMVMHIPRWIALNWEVIRHKPVVWRTIGQSHSRVEHELLPYRRDGLRIVRYSPRESQIPRYLGEDAIIRFYKDSAELGGWTGTSPHVLTINQSLPHRPIHCNFELYQYVTRDLPRKLYGPGNDAAGRGVMGPVDWDALQAALRENTVYFYVGTQPASYTLNFIEAWMTGIPVVAIGPEYGHPYQTYPFHELYEIPDIIENGVNGFYADDPDELHDLLRRLLDDRNLCRAVGEAGRRAAIRHFGKETIRPQWEAFFKELC